MIQKVIIVHQTASMLLNPKETEAKMNEVISEHNQGGWTLSYITVTNSGIVLLFSKVK